MQHHSRKMFLGYSFYAWGCPTVVSTITLVLDIMAPENIILPEFNAGTCWFKGEFYMLLIVYINLCIGLLLLLPMLIEEYFEVVWSS